MFKRIALPEQSLVGDPIRLPIMVLLMVPDNPYLNDAHVFNLPGAINDLMGGAGWHRTVKVLQPRIWAPGWSKKQLSKFASQPSPAKGRRIPEEAIRDLHLKEFPPMGDRPVNLKVEWPVNDVIHVVNDFALGGLLPEPVFRLRMNKGVQEDDFKSGRVIPAGRLRDILIAVRTRLLILQVAHYSAANAERLARNVVGAGGPATVVISGGTPQSLDRYFTDLYADIIHNKPLSEVVATAAEPDAPDVAFVAGPHADEALRLTPLFHRLVASIESVKAADRAVVERVVGDNVRLLHTAQLDRLRLKVRTTALRLDRSRAVMENLPRLDALRESMNFARETGGALPLAEMAEAEPDLAATLAELNDAHLRYPQLEQELAAELDEMARCAPRVLNATFADPSAQRLVEPMDALREGGAYDLLVDVGPRWNRVRSLVTGNDVFPEKALPPNKDGHLIRVLFFSEDFLPVQAPSEEPKTVPSTPSPSATTFEAVDIPPLDDSHSPSAKIVYGPPIASAEIWVPSGTGRSFPVINGQRSERAGPVRLPLFTPTGPPSTTLEARGRLSLYYENNLIQSAAVRVAVGEGRPRPLWFPNSIDVDFALSGSFVDLGRYATRVLGTAEEKKTYKVSVNIALNSDAGGGHRIMIANRNDLAAFRPYDPLAAEKLLQNAREKLKEVFALRDDGCVVTEPEAQRRDSLDKDNAKELRQFKCDLWQLAWYGSDLFAEAFGQLSVPNLPAYLVQLQQALTSRTVIQVVRTVGQYVYPWAMIYDIPLPNKTIPGALRWCDVLKEWTGPQARRTLKPADRCPFHDTPEHKQDTLCPYGFWGLKHYIEQPINVMPEPPNAADRVPSIVPDASSTINLRKPMTFGLGITRDAVLDPKAIQKHLDNVRGVVKAFTPANGADEWSAVQAMLVQPDVVYFLCHGEYDAQAQRPYLGVGLRDNNPVHRIYPNQLFDWLRTETIGERWIDHRPLIFINGCHTANLKPGEVLNFVTTFARFGASAVIGTEISIRLPLAAEVGEKLITKTLSGEPVGAVIHDLRWELANKGNLLGLAYTPYCLSNLALSVQ